MLGLLALGSLATAGLSLLGVISVYPADWKLIWWPVLVDFGAAVVANVTTYKSADKLNNAGQERIYHSKRKARRDRLDVPGKHG